MPDYLEHGRRHGPGGSDPIPGLASGTGNDWVYARKGVGSVAAAGSATAAYNEFDIIYQTDNGSVFAAEPGTVNAIGFEQVGSYLVRAIATFPTGHSGSVLVGTVLGGDLTAYDYDVHDGTQGADSTRGQAIWEQLCVVHSVSSPPTSYVTFTNNTSPGVTLVGVVLGLQMFRIT